MALGIPSASPAVNFREIDLTGSVPNQVGSTGGIAGNFSWGPVAEPILVSNEAGLVSVFGAPTTANTIDFHGASYFLKYANALYVVREIDGDSAGDASARNAYAPVSSAGDAATTSPLVKNKSDFDIQDVNLDDYSGDSDGNAVRGHTLIARYPGTLGNSLEVQICPGDSDANAVFNAWAYKNEFDGAPGTSDYVSARDGAWDEVHVVVIDKNGTISGTAGTILEKYPYVSTASDAKDHDGDGNYIRDIINERSNYIYFSSFGSSLSFDSDEWGLSSNLGSATTAGSAKTYTNNLPVRTYTLGNGVNSGTLALADQLRAQDRFEDPETLSVDILIAPPMGTFNDQVSATNDLVAIAASRKDCIVVSSTNRAGIINTAKAGISTNIALCANSFTNSSYLAVDGNFFKIYDKYNDQYIWIPAASSTAGLMAATDANAGPWWSPAGQSRGQYLGVTGLAWNPNKTERDTLYKAGVNPIATLVGQGTLLYGDKTKLNRPSAFDRINVRRLFLKIEKDIVAYAKTVMFEFNDEFTRSEFTSVVEAYLRDIQARRGIQDFRVVCDETNNTAAVVDNNEFIASVFVKPSRSINFITLNFISVRSGVSFEEVVGRV